MNYFNKERSLSTLAALLMFALFAIGILSILLGGANVYRRFTQRDTQSYDRRTCIQYLATKLRQAPAPGAVSVAPFGSGDALLIYETVENETYVTRIYCHDGWLMELFTVANGIFSPEDGEKILPMEEITPKIENALVTIFLTDSSNTRQQVTLQIRGMLP